MTRELIGRGEKFGYASSLRSTSTSFSSSPSTHLNAKLAFCYLLCFYDLCLLKDRDNIPGVNGDPALLHELDNAQGIVQQAVGHQRLDDCSECPDVGREPQANHLVQR